MKLLKRLHRRYVKTEDDMTTRGEARAVWYMYVGKDAEVAALAESYQRLLDERADAILLERERLTSLLVANRGEYGPTEWGKGYYEASDDAADIVSKGQ